MRCAAVIPAGFMRSPDAVLEVSAYHEARPQLAAAASAWVLAKAESINTAAENAKRAGRRLARIVVIDRTVVSTLRLHNGYASSKARRLCQSGNRLCR